MIAIGSDHGGFPLKQVIIEYFESEKILYNDFGTHSAESCDYPVYAKAVADAVVSGECELGILVCSTGIGISIAANKIRGIRCALCGDPFSAEMTRRHNDANILALGGLVVGDGLALNIVKAFLGHEFEGGRHSRRVGLISDLES